MVERDISTFLSPGPLSGVHNVAVLHLRRDQLLPVRLTGQNDDSNGYFEGQVVNTRFGSFPHSTLVGLPWGSQVRASIVDTGSRGRKGVNGTQPATKKRKREAATQKLHGSEGDENDNSASERRTPVAASSGFIHILPPTAETWTASLPHRTQVVYTPDYSYILHRLRVRPGGVLIEAGAGSGSFTHAAVRSIFNGYPTRPSPGADNALQRENQNGKVFSYEFHGQRAEKLNTEVREHKLDNLVHITHRDVYKDGFLIPKDGGDGFDSPGADAVFLDLPAPWLALRHLTRRETAKADEDELLPQSSQPEVQSESPTVAQEADLTPARKGGPEAADFSSPLNPNAPVYVCAFSPCIEQAQRTVSTLREMGWVDIDVVTVAHKRIEVRRERVGYQERGVQATASNVEEAIDRLKQIEGRFRLLRQAAEAGDGTVENGAPPPSCATVQPDEPGPPEDPTARKLYKEGRLVHRSEPELKSHTSYLVFALLPREWTAEDEQQAQMIWPSSSSPKQTQIDIPKAGRKKETKTGVAASDSTENDDLASGVVHIKQQ